MDYSLAIANSTALQTAANFHIDGAGRATNLFLGSAQKPAEPTNSVVIPYQAGLGAAAPGLKWSDGTWANTGSLALDGNGPNGLSWQGDDNFPCLMVRAPTGSAASGAVVARMCEDGSITGSIKNFEEVDPRNKDRRIVYASLEGPEAAMYARGSGSVAREPVTIALPDHFTVLAAKETITTSLTPIGSCPGGLYVVSRDGAKVVVARETPSDKPCKFDYLVVGVRARYRDYKVVRDAE